MNPIHFKFPYLNGFRPKKGSNNTVHPFGKAFSDLYWRMLQANMFLDEIKRHTRKMDKRITMVFFGKEFQIPALGVNASTKKDLERNKQEVERMVADGMIIILVSVVEYFLRDACHALKTSKNLKLSWNELRGDPLHRFRTYFEKVGGQKLEISNEDWEFLKAVDKLRNTIAHSMGEIGDSDRPFFEKFSRDNANLKIVDDSIVPNLEFVHTIINKLNMILNQSIMGLVNPELQDLITRAKNRV